MTTQQVSSLFAALKQVRCRCLDRAEVLEKWLAENPEADVREARAVSLMAGRVPFPSINGNPPVYRDRPYFDARLFEEKP